MKRNAVFAVVLGAVLLMGSLNCHAADWVKQNVDIPNKSVDANFYDGSSVKAHNKTLSWTEKFVLTDFGAKHYTKHLSTFQACKENIAKKGDAAYHQLDFEIKEGKFRVVAKRNYNKDNVLLCTDKDMGTDLDKSWNEIIKGSPMYERYYTLATKYKIGDI
ncbi:MAG TPA: hypothetical protein VN642_02360 [Dongiaceae bacterium]|nr:hypothetical protein [Dongiaceae bacterium]